MLTSKRLSIKDAKILIDVARAKAIEIDIPMCIAVVDESGQLIAFERMNGGKVTSEIIAQDKAFILLEQKNPLMSIMKHVNRVI